MFRKPRTDEEIIEVIGKALREGSRDYEWGDGGHWRYYPNLGKIVCYSIASLEKQKKIDDKLNAIINYLGCEYIEEEKINFLRKKKKKAE